MDHEDLRVEATGDGSQTLYSDRFAAHYHSTHGAHQESEHVFISAGLDRFLALHPSRTRVSILEFGLGTGLNALLTYTHAQRRSIDIYYHGLEAYPPDPALMAQLDYARAGDPEVFRKIHAASWSHEHSLGRHFMLYKELVTFEAYQPSRTFDLVYFDAFGPRTQPDLWTEEVLSTAADSLERGGILVTFCAQGAFKRALRAVGFEVERLPGPPGKREMTRATKI